MDGADRDSDGEGSSRRCAALEAENAALRERNALLESIVAVIDDSVFAKDRAGRYLLVNPVAARFFDRPAGDVVGRIDAELLPAETARRVLEDDRELLARGETRTFEEGVTLAGVPRRFLTTKGVHRDGRGEPVGVIGISRDVTERKSAEEALRETREFLERLLDYSPAAIYATSLDGRRILVNRAWEDFWRKPREEVVGRPLEEVLPPEVAHLSLRESRTVVEAQAPLAFEEDIAAPDGVRSLYSVKFPLRDAEGRIEAVGGISFDITERKRTERALRLSEERFRGAFEHAAVGMAIVDAGGQFVKVNPALSALIGYPEAELLGRDFLSVTHEEDRIPSMEAVRRLRAGDVPSVVVEKRYRARGGGVVWARTSVALVPDESGERRHAIALIQDIGEQRRAEAEQRRLLQELEAERGRLAEVFRRSPAFMAVSRGPDLVLERANDLFYELVGHPAREALPELEGQGYFEMAERVYRTGEPYAGTELHVRLRPDPGGPLVDRYVDLVCVPLRDADGAVSGVLGHGVDRTESIRTREELKAARRRLAELSRRLISSQEQERRRLSRELHDVFGQELTALKLGLHAAAGDSIPGDCPELARDATEAIDRMIAQVRDLAFELRPASLDDLGLIPALRSYASRLAARAGLDLSFAGRPIDRHLPAEVQTECFRIAQEALTNVVRHARARRVRVELGLAADRLSLLVGDDGAGFDPCSLGGGSARVESLGLLGMRERAELLGGRLDIESAPGRGCLVRAMLPIAPDGTSAAT